MTYHSAVQANCQADGNIEYWACSVCEKNYNAEENGEVIENVTVVDKDNHTDLITLDAVAATCTETGLTEGQKCNACGVTTIKQDIVPALNHLDENSDNICDREDCLAVMCDGSHIWEDKKDETMHWEECSACHEIQNAETHNYVNPEYRVVDGALKLVSTCVCGEEKVEDVEEEVIEVSSEKDLATVLSAGVDVVLTEEVTLTEGSLEITKSVNVDLNGNDIIVNGVKGDVCEAFYVRGAGVEVTITNAGDVIANTDSEEAEHIIAVSATEGAIVNIQGGNFVSYGSSTIYATTGAVINIYGGRFEAKELYGGVNYLIDINETIARENWGKINVYGGEFVGFNPANHTNDGAEYTNKVAEGYHSILVGDAYVVSAHNHSSEETAPTCTTAGYTTYTCVCGDTYEVAGADALGHEYGDLVEKVEATCSKEGMEAHYFCDVCDIYFDAEKNETTVDALTLDKDPNAHAYGEWTTVDGNHSRVCANDNTHTESGACADENADDKCDVCGADMPVEELAATPYNYSFTGKVFNGNGTQALGDVNWTLSGDATTFNYDGSNGRGQQFGTGSAPATVITLTSEKKFGNIGKIIVNAAGATNTNAVLTVKVGGNIVGTFNVTKAAADYEVTFEEAIKGVVEIELTQTSKVAMYIKTIFIDKPACKHIETQDVDEIPATCLETGLTAGKKCVACGEYTEGGEEIAKADHNYGADGKCTTEGCDAEQGVAAEPETVTMTTFTATSGDLGEGASFTTAKGGGTTAPAVNSGEIRLYQNSAGTGGGTITISAKEGYKIQSVTIGSSMKTSIAYTIDGGSTKSATESLVANGKYTYDASEVDTITFYCMGADKNSRLYVNYLSVTYVEA